MKKYLNKIIFLLTLILTFVSLTECNLALSTSKTNIRIGLFFNNTALETAVSSSPDININYYSNILATLQGVSTFKFKPINDTVYLTNVVFKDLTSAFIQANTSNNLLEGNYFVYLDLSGYRLATTNTNGKYEIINSSKANKIGIYHSGNVPFIVYDDSVDLKFESTDEKYITIQDIKYRGTISFKVDSNKKLTVINTLPIEEYLYGVVPKEMPSSWNMDSLKAQSISARNYAMKNLNKFNKLGFDLCNTQNSQVYGGYSAETNSTNIAVKETNGIMAYYNGQIADLFYHSSSGGRTEDSENIWSAKIDYLRSVDDPFSIGSPFDYWEYGITKNDIKTILDKKEKHIGNIIGIRIDNISPNGRILKMTIVGSDSEISYEKEHIRSFFGYSNIKSNWFTLNNNKNLNYVKVEDTEANIFDDLNAVLKNTTNSNLEDNINSDLIISDYYLFQGKGFGHGIGMSQYGAKNMGNKGYNYVDILKYYFSGIEIY